MFGAMKAVQECGSSIDRAAIEYGVPQTILRDRISGRVTHGVNPGPKPYLNATEEVELSTFSQQCASIGYGKTRRDVLYIAQSTAEDKSGKDIAWMVEEISSDARKFVLRIFSFSCSI